MMALFCLWHHYTEFATLAPDISALNALGFILFKAREAFGPVVVPLQLLARALKLDSFTVNVNLYDILTCVAQKADSN